MIRLPDYGGDPTLAEQFELAVFLARWIVSVQLHGNIKSQGAERNDAIELLLSTFLADARPMYEAWLDDMEKRGEPYELARWRALLRDGMRCLKCRHRRSNAGGVESHHIVPRSSGGQDHEDNLATLCRACHAEITHPAPGNHWREQAPVLRQLIVDRLREA